MANDDGEYAAMGDTTNAPNLGTEGSCGGGGRHHHGLARFTPAMAGRYRCGLDAGNEDTILYVRTHCSVDDPAAELACNDDAPAGSGLPERGSLVEFNVGENETVYLFVDGFGAGFETQFSLVCRGL